MKCELIYDNVSKVLTIPKELLPESGVPFAHHYQSTPADNLIELAGRTCYDSSKTEKTRGSVDYHKHINEVNHGSTQEHVNFKFLLPFTGPDKVYQPHPETYNVFLNRPGVWVEDILADNFWGLSITANIRAINEWNDFDKFGQKYGPSDRIGEQLQYLAKPLAPLALKYDHPEYADEKGITLVQPYNSEDRWASFFITGVSRGLSHELVRHKWRTAVSQRSTRYVDESESGWAWHPLLRKYGKEIIDYFPMDNYPLSIDHLLNTTQSGNAESYNRLVEFLQEKLIAEGIEKFAARKQARGAARGILGNALTTEMIFSASLGQWARMILQRANNAADAEIRVLFAEIFNQLKNRFPDVYNDEIFHVENASDGFGYHITRKVG